MDSGKLLEEYANVHELDEDLSAVPLELVSGAFKQFFTLKKQSMEVLADEHMRDAVDTALGRLMSQESTRGNKKRKAEANSGMSPDAKKPGKGKDTV